MALRSDDIRHLVGIVGTDDGQLYVAVGVVGQKPGQVGPAGNRIGAHIGIAALPLLDAPFQFVVGGASPKSSCHKPTAMSAQ